MNSTTKQTARERVRILFQQATCINKTNPELAQKYVATARKIAMSARMRLPTVYRRQICKECNTLLVPGETSRVRIKPRREPHIVVTCIKCGNQTRITLKPKFNLDTKQEKHKVEQNNK